MYPYLINNKLPLEHDTLFHLSRIEGYARAIRNYDFFPVIYPYKNNGFGYASPLFYCDIFLLIPAVLYNLGLGVSTCYKIAVFLATYASSLTFYLALHAITKKKSASIIGVLAYLFSNYHISDVYVRSSLGEIFAFIFFPIVLWGIYNILYEEKINWVLLVIGFSGLLLSHNISFLFSVILFGLFLIINIKKVLQNKLIIISLLKAVGFTILITLFFLLPMFEMMASDKYFVTYYSYTEYLKTSALLPWQFFANETVFGMGTSDATPAMVVNVGYFLTFIPLIYFSMKNKNSFITTCLFLGYFFMFMTSSFFPWIHFGFLSVIQFTWRLNLLVITLLTPVVSYIFSKVDKKFIHFGVAAILVIECFIHITPVLQRKFVITNETTYAEIISTKITDPYFAATYVRTELAGGEYLPITTPDIKKYGKCIKDDEGNELTCDYVRDYDKLYFNVGEGTIVLPITFYKGYNVYRLENGIKVPINTYPNKQALVSFVSGDRNNYVCEYDKTLIQTTSIYISLISTVSFVLYVFYFKKRGKSNV